MSWYARTGPQHKQSAKFRPELRLGVAQSQGDEYRGWFFSFVAHQTGSGVRRTRYAVSISDSNHHRVAYLRDCSSIEQATQAAKHWIDEALSRSSKSTPTKSVGTIPTLPEFVDSQKK